MNAKEYVTEALRTMSPMTTQKTILLGFRGETGEVADLVKKVTGHGHEIDRSKFVKELGDCSWYGANKLKILVGETTAANLMGTRVEFVECLEDLAEMLCEAGARLGQSVYPFEACDHGLEFFGLIGEIGQRLTPPASLAEIWATNRDKLRARYPLGFTVEASKVKGEEAPQSIPAAVSNFAGLAAREALPFEVDNYATAGHYPPGPAYTCPHCGSSGPCLLDCPTVTGVGAE